LPFHVPLLTPIFPSFFQTTQTTQTTPNIPTEIDPDCDHQDTDILPSLQDNTELNGPDLLAEIDILASSLEPASFNDPSYQWIEDLLEL
jgi:hypothetical protein